MAKSNEDPAAELAKANRAASDERKLIVFLDQIIDQEEIRREAYDKIKRIWKEVRKAGHDEADARRALVRRATTRPSI